VEVHANGEALRPDQAVTLGIRPEHLEPAANDGSIQQISRTVSLVEQLGEHSYLHLDQPGGAVLIAKAPGDKTPRQGESVMFNVPPASCHLFTEDGFAVTSAAVKQFA
jgi:multiple sugar transport system ATP-binding protein